MTQVAGKIRLLHVIESLGLGGAERMLVTNIAHLDRDKFHSVVAYLYDGCAFAPELARMNIKVYPLHIKSISEPFKAIQGLSRIIREEKIDIVHTHLFAADIYGRIAAKLCGIRRVVTTLHNLGYKSYSAFNNRFFFERRRIIDKLTGRLCNKAFITVSEAVKESSEKSLGFRNIKVIHNSIDMNKFSPLTDKERIIERQKLGIRQDAVVLVNVGRMDSQKGHRFLLEAMFTQDLRHKDIILLLLGRGPCEGRLKDTVKKLGLETKVIFLGDNYDVRSIVGCADIFILPTINEGFGISLLEAMALEKPCIASDVDGVREIINHGIDGVLVKPASVSALAEAVSELVGKPDLRLKIAAAGLTKVYEKFNIQDKIKPLEEIYISLYN